MPKHVSFAYTTGAESHVVVEITPSHNLSVVPAGQFQQVFIDNVHLRGATQTKVAFLYNDRGHRIQKISYRAQTTQTTTYVCDASGSVMAIHQHTMGPQRTIPRIEHPVYGASRIGIYKREGKTGYTLYELTDHLGNVRAVIRKTPTGLLSLTSKTDYYPFGMPMPNRQTTDNNYRYAFQGQEKDNETGMEAFELRLWDGRIGRWLTIDPYHEFFSPYVGMGNNPINLIDPDGGSTEGCPNCPSKGSKIGEVVLGDNGEQWKWNGTTWAENSLSEIVVHYVKSSKTDWGHKYFALPADISMKEFHKAVDDAKQSIAYAEAIVPWKGVLENYTTAALLVNPPAQAGRLTGFGTSREVGKRVLGSFYTPLAVESTVIWGKNSVGHLVKHAKTIGFDVSAQQAQKMIPQLKEVVKNLIKNANPALTRVGRWHSHENAIMYISDGKMIVTEANGTFITIINKTSNNWYQLAKPLR